MNLWTVMGVLDAYELCWYEHDVRINAYAYAYVYVYVMYIYAYDREIVDSPSWPIVGHLLSISILTLVYVIFLK